MLLSNSLLWYFRTLLLCFVASLSLSPSFSAIVAATCPVPCLCQSGPLLNCSSAGLSQSPPRIPATVTSLDLSYNGLRRIGPVRFGRGPQGGALQELWVGGNDLEELSLCKERDSGGSRTLVRTEERCASWAPKLQLLSADRGQLKALPKGLGSAVHLRLLQLSHNQISALGPEDLARCAHLRELHLQHNLISSIHPTAFRDLRQLQVLDLSFNLLTTIPMQAYLSLQHLPTRVEVVGNRWHCDCRLQAMRRWMTFDRVQSGTTWRVECVLPSHLSGKELAHLGHSDLTCLPPEHSKHAGHQDVTVDEGMAILLPCTTHSRDWVQARWWTPQGPAQGSQLGLLITGSTEQDAGLYVCVSGPLLEQISVYNLYVRKRDRELRVRRDTQVVRHESGEQENVWTQRGKVAVRQSTRTQSEFALAVSLSVIVTFILAFILGVLLRPLLDKLCRRICNKRKGTPSPNSPTSSSTGPQPHVNEGYSESEDMEREVRAGSRVTFGGVSEVRDQGVNMPYYVTVEEAKHDSSSESDSGAEVTCNNNQSITTSVEVDNHQTQAQDHDTCSFQNSEQQEKTVLSHLQRDEESVNTRVMEFEHIPDPTENAEREERSSSSASTHSSLSQEQHIFQQVEQSHELSVDPPVFEHQPTNIPPSLAQQKTLDWSQNLQIQGGTDINPLDPELWNDSGESFSFTEGSARSSSQDFSGSVLSNPFQEGHNAWFPAMEEVSVDTGDHIYAQIDDFNQPPFDENHIRLYQEVSVDDIRPEISPSHDLIGHSDKLSSCSSSESGESDAKQTEYIVNLENEEEEEEEPTQNTLSSNEAVYFSEDPIYRDGYFRKDAISFGEAAVVDEKRWGHSGSLDFSRKNEDQPKQYNVHPVYRSRLKQLEVSPSEQRHRLTSSSSSEDDETSDKYSSYPRRLEIKTEQDNSRWNSTQANEVPIKTSGRVININFDNSSSSTDVGMEKSGREGQKRTLKGISGLSALLFKKDQAKKSLKSSAPQPPVTEGSISVVDLKSESRRSSVSSSSDESVRSTTEADSSALQMDLSLDHLPRPKRSLLFSNSYPKSTSQSPSPPPDISGIELEKTTGPRVDVSSQGIEQSWFQEAMSVPFNQLPKPKKSLLFSAPAPQLPTQPSVTKGSISAVDLKSESMRSSVSSSSDESVRSTTEADSSALQMDLSLDHLPRPKRSLLFSNSYPKSASQSPSPPPDISGIKLEKTTGPRVDVSSQGIEKSWFQEAMSVPFNQLPKPKKSLLFSAPAPQLPTQPSVTKGSISAVDLKSESRRSSVSSSSDESVRSTTEADSSALQMDLSLDHLPRPKRSLLFSNSYPKSASQSPSPPPDISGIKLEKTTGPRVDVSSQGIEQSWFQEAMSVPFNQLPKPKKSLLFSAPAPQLPTQPSVTKGSISAVDLKSESRRSSVSSSSDESVRSTTEADSSALQMDLSLDHLPRPKRSLLFSNSYPKSASQSPSPPPDISGIKLEKTTGPRVDVSSLGTEKSWFQEAMSVPFNQLPKPKKSLLFSAPAPQLPTQPSVTKGSISAVDLKSESRRSSVSSSSDESVRSTTDADSSGLQMDLSLDHLPRPKRSLLFSNSYPKSASQSPSPPPDISGIKLEKTTGPRVDVSSQGIEKSWFQEAMSVPFNQLPKPKKSLLFSAHAPQLPTQPSVTKGSISAADLKSESRRSSVSSSSDESVRSTTEADSSALQMDLSLDHLPRPKRSLLFSNSNPRSPSPPPDISGIKLEKTTGPRVDTSSQCKETSWFQEAMSVPFDQLPKPQKSLLFVSHDPRSSTQLSVTQGSTSVVELKPESRRSSVSSSSDESFRSTTEADSSALQMDLSLNHLPRPKRSLLFSTSYQKSASRSPSPPPDISGIKLGTKPGSIVDHSSQSTERSWLQEATSVPFDQLPKPKSSLQFVSHDPKPSTELSVTKGSTSVEELKSESRRSSVSSSSDESVGSITEADSSALQMDMSLDHPPRPKESQLFSTSYHKYSSQSPSPPQHISGINLEAKQESKVDGSYQGRDRSWFQEAMSVPFDQLPKFKRSSSSSSGDTVRPSTNREGFPGQIDVSFDKLPKPKKSLLFARSETQPSQSSYASNTLSTSDTVTKYESRLSSSSSESSIGSNTDAERSALQMDLSLDHLPKLKRSLLFSTTYTKSTSQSSSPPPNISDIKQGAKPGPIADASSQGTVRSWFQEALSVPFDRLPKLKKSLLFSTPDPQPSIRSLDNKSSSSIVGFSSETKKSRMSSSSDERVRSITDANTTEGWIGSSLDQLTRPKKSLIFSTSDLQHPTYPPPPPPSHEKITSQSDTQADPIWTSSSSKETITPHTDGGNLAQSMGLSFDQCPKPKKSLLLTSHDTKVPTLSKSSPPSNRGSYSDVEGEQDYRGMHASSSDGASDNPDEERNSLSRGLGFSLDQLPKPRRSLVFTTHGSESPPQASFSQARASKALVSQSVSSRLSSTSSDTSGTEGDVGHPMQEHPISPSSVHLPSGDTRDSGYYSLERGIDVNPEGNSMGDFVSNAAQVRRRLMVNNIQPPLEAPPAVPQTPPPSPQWEENSTIRDHQTRRLIFQQRRRIIGGFSRVTPSPAPQEGDQNRIVSSVSLGGAIPFHSDHTYRKVSSGHVATDISDSGAQSP